MIDDSFTTIGDEIQNSLTVTASNNVQYVCRLIHPRLQTYNVFYNLPGIIKAISITPTLHCTCTCIHQILVVLICQIDVNSFQGHRIHDFALSLLSRGIETILVNQLDAIVVLHTHFVAINLCYFQGGETAMFKIRD